VSDRADGMRQGALAGVRVLEAGTGVSAPLCTRVLRALGADVTRLMPSDGSRSAEPVTAFDAWLHVGKRSLSLSPDDADGVLARAAAGADLLVTNLSPTEQRAWGITPARLGTLSTDLVVLALSPCGTTGPWAHAPAPAINVSAIGGMSVILGEPGRPPLSFPFELPAMQAALHGAAAALTALFARRRSGHGQLVDVAEADVMAFLAGGMSLFILGSGGRWERRGFERHGGIYPSGFYPCQDGFVFLATQSRAQWKAFLRLMGNPEWAEADPVLQDGVAIGWQRADEVDLHFIPWLAERTRAELVEIAAREPDIVLGPINDVSDVLASTHLDQREFWEDVQMGGRTVRMPGFGCALSGTAVRAGAPPPPARAATSARPLAGHRIVEFGWNWAGPLVGQMLADMGAEVIKVETKSRLDFMRHWPHARAFFHNANRGKLSVSVNVKHPEGRDLVRRLVAHADAVFDNFSAGVMERNGFGWEALRAIKPDVIAMSMAMAGQTGPLRHLRGFATMATGFAGLESAIGYPATGPTGLPAIGIGDANAAIQGVIALLAALWHRDRTGEGRFIDLSQIEAATLLMADPIADYQTTGRIAGPHANHHDRMAPHGTYPVAGDDRWIAIAVTNDAEWNALVQTMEAPAWARDEALAHATERLRRRDELDTHLAGWTRGFERDSLVERLRSAGVAAAPVLEIDELNAWPHFVARNLYRDVPSFEGGTAPAYSTPWHLTATPGGIDRPSPKLGEHNDYVFGELLGLSEADRAALTEQEVIG